MHRILDGISRGPTRVLCAAALVFALSTTAAMAQFYATHDDNGDTVVVDQNALPVQIAQADPVGERPSYCPAGSFYVSEVLTDKTELVLTDCIVSSLQFTVQMAPHSDAPAE